MPVEAAETDEGQSIPESGPDVEGANRGEPLEKPELAQCPIQDAEEAAEWQRLFPE